ncbi:MAG TPA: plastocyanin/azurin family copper-binding protein, partial [Nitrospirota bacterium]
TSPVTVSATEYVFTPSAVHAPVNGVVMWTNNGAMTHSVTSGTGGMYSGLFDSTLNPTQSVCLKFTTAGTFNYYCKFHFLTNGMAGSVTVP